MTKVLTYNDDNFSKEEMDLIRFLALRRQLSFVVERALKTALNSKDLPIVVEAKEALKRRPPVAAA